MNLFNNRKEKNSSNSFLAKLVVWLLLETTATNCQTICDKTSNVLECYFCSNTKANKECSDKDGTSLNDQWTVLKSLPGQDTSELR